MMTPTDTKEPLAVLVVDDEPSHAEVVASGLEKIGAVSTVVHSESEAAAAVSKRLYDVVVTDLMLDSPTGGLNVLRLVKERQPETEVIVMTAFSGIETAVEAIQQGAFNYLAKPLDLKQLRAIVQRAGEGSRLRRVNRQLTEQLDERFGLGKLIGGSKAMTDAVSRLKRIAPTDATVMILGETGTGKELFAQAIHQNSPRRGRPFVALNCAALSENILESELFGHVKGAFTGATDNRVGKFEYAQGGTIFLDEVGDMPMATQIKLLRVLENGEITRVGSNEVIKVNVRLLSATNRDLDEEIKSGALREDLYHRLKMVTMRLPPLRERTDDIPILLDHFLKIFEKKYNKRISGVTPAVRRRLFAYDWPGNVRQLRNAAESMVVVDFDGLLDVDDLPEDILAVFPPDSDADVTPGVPPVPPPVPAAAAADVGSAAWLVGRTMEEIELTAISETLKACGGNREATAKMLGIGERTLYRKLKEIEKK